MDLTFLICLSLVWTHGVAGVQNPISGRTSSPGCPRSVMRGDGTGKAEGSYYISSEVF